MRTFAAVVDGAAVGAVTLHHSEYEDTPIAGIYDMGVAEPVRRQGIGTALTVAASRAARERGCRQVLLNATAMGEPVYVRAGFNALGVAGQTWWMPAADLEAEQPSRNDIALVEAIGTGDVATVRAALKADPDPRDVRAELACQLTLVEIAEVTGQHAIAEWLTAREL